MNNAFLKKSWPYLLCVIVFAIVSAVYMSPFLTGKVIVANDNLSWRGAYQEVKEYQEETGNSTWWTGSMFSGMPTYQIGGGETFASELLHPLNFITHYGSNKANPVVMVFLYALAFFVLLLSFGVNKWLSAVGALAMAFSSYFFIIIGASHNSKTATLALFAFVVAGFYMIYHGKRAWGVCLTMLFVAVGYLPHPQMAYYYCFIIGFCVLAELWNHYKSGQWKRFLVSTALFAGAFLIGMGTGSSLTFANMEYATETMRGGHSDLVKDSDEKNRTKGLDLDYATAWSYGVDETLTLLIPNAKGGASNYSVGEKSGIYDTMLEKKVDKKYAKQFCQNVPTYWGTQPFTAGPVYVGAIVCFLFVLGLIVVKGAYKWALLAVTLLTIMLSWGHNFMPLTKFFFSVFPMYSKFRAVSSILIVAEVTMPLLGFLALKKISERSVDKKKMLLSVGISAGVVGGLCLLVAMLGAMFYDFTSPTDQSAFSQLPEWLVDSIVDERSSMFFLDCFRSLLFVLLAAGVICLYVWYDGLKTPYFAAILGLLVLTDMWVVDKRYMNDSAFSSDKAMKSFFKKKPYEEQLLSDPSHFRVLNLATNTFNEARTSYYFKSIGGYSAAKLRRYQDLIDQHIAPEFNPLFSAISSTGGRLELCDGDSIFPVLNMLNAKYFIVPLQTKEEVAVPNPHAMGNAWFVESAKVVRNANEECDGLSSENLRKVAILDEKFSSFVKNGGQYGVDSSATIELTQYAPNQLDYKSSSSKDGLAVFSEIYYPYGWKAYIDGKPEDHFRVDYALRALNIPAGEHTISFKFSPDSIAKGNVISVICVLIMYLIILFVAYLTAKGKENALEALGEGGEQCHSLTTKDE